MATEAEIDAYVNTQLSISDARTKNAIADRVTKTRFPRRSAILKLQRAIRGFRLGQDPRWIAVLGLRGVGKTTMLSQLFQDIKCSEKHKIFVAIDDAIGSLGIGVGEIISSYERVLNTHFENLIEPIYLFIDEIHFDPNWSISLKAFVG